MPDPKFPPALRKPTSEYPTPSPAVGFFTEIVDRTDAAYVENAPVTRGTLYSTIKGAKKSVIDAYPLLYFVRESKLGNSDQLVIWIWSTVFNAESSYNAEITYLGDAVANPSFARVYKIRRDVYDAATPPARGSTLTALTGVRITAVGTGYTHATGTVGTGATVEFVVNSAGQIIAGVVTNEGSGVTSGASIAITGDGTGATATAIVQPVTAILTSEKKQEFPEDDVLRNEFVKVIRVYEVLPGPYLPFTRYDENLGPIQGQRRAVVNTGQVTVLGATSKTTYEARDGSSYVSWEIQESWSDGTGSPGNPAYPIGITDFNDPERGPVHQVSQVTTDTTSAGSSTVSGGTVTTIRYEPYKDNPNLRTKIIETWTVPRALSGKDTNRDKQVVSVTDTRKAPGSDAVPTALKDVVVKNMGDGTVLQTERDIPNVFDKDTRSIEIPDVTPSWAKALLPTTQTSSEAAATSVSDPTLSTGQLRKTVQRTTEKTVETAITARSLASLPRTRTNKRLVTEFGGGAVDEVETVATGSQSISAGGLLVLDSEMEVLGDGTSVLKTSTQTDGSWPILYDYDVDPETGQTILTSYQVVSAADAGTGEASGGVVLRYKHIDRWRSLKIEATYSTPADYEEQRFGAFSFPALFAGSAYYSWTSECGAFILAGGLRSAFAASVPHRVVISFSVGRPSNIDGLTLIPQTLVLGKGVQLPQDILCDSDSFTYSGACSGTVSFGGSDPDYSTYTGSIQGTEQLVTGESVVDPKSGLYKTTSVYVTMK